MDKRQVCVQHYIDKGYSIEHSTEYVGNDPKRIEYIYEKIQEEESLPPIERPSNPLLLD